MTVQIDTKNWMGNYNSRIKEFNNRAHLDNYLNKCYRDETTSKVIGVTIITN